MLYQNRLLTGVNKKLIFYIVLIIVILIFVFLSQQVYSRWVGKNLISGATSRASAYLAKGSDWVMSGIYPKISNQLKSGGDAIQTKANQTKQNNFSDAAKKIGNYFSGIANSILHPGSAQSRQASAGQ